MTSPLQEFQAEAARKCAANLEAALLRVPEEKRAWSPAETARTALDQVAECAILNGSTADLIESRVWPAASNDFEAYRRRKEELARDWSAVKAMLDANTERMTAAIRAVPDADLGVQIEMPWGPMTLAEIIAYPQWNMTYHEGQINYIASILGCLD